MKIHIVGESGAFGSFLKELLAPHFEFGNLIDTQTIILAVPSSQYENAIQTLGISSIFKLEDRHLVNVCSVQSITTQVCLKYTKNVTSIHPLFGRRTPSDKRNSIVTYSYQLANHQDDSWWYDSDNPENCFMREFRKVSTVMDKLDGLKFTPESHDQLMAKTHVAAVLAAQQMKIYIDRAKDIPDELIPNSFRLLRDFVKTLDDMPKGTIESIMANPYF